MIYWIKPTSLGEQIEVMHSNGSVGTPDMGALRFIDAWCMQYGSTYEGRRIACATNMAITQKIPILISEQTRDIIFPVCNIRSWDCMWINYRGVDSYKGIKKQCQILFHNGTSITIGVDVRTIRREMRLCKDYLALLGASPR